jgi:hypothetical protein
MILFEIILEVFSYAIVEIIFEKIIYGAYRLIAFVFFGYED